MDILEVNPSGFVPLEHVTGDDGGVVHVSSTPLNWVINCWIVDGGPCPACAAPVIDGECVHTAGCAWAV